jgi:hypothetical protein
LQPIQSVLTPPRRSSDEFAAINFGNKPGTLTLERGEPGQGRAVIRDHRRPQCEVSNAGFVIEPP